MRTGNFLEGVHIGRASIEMNRKNCFGARSYGCFCQGGIEICGARIDVRKHNLRAGVRDRFGGGDESIGRGDDFSARPNARGQKREMEGAGAGIERDAVTSFAVIGELLLERCDFVSQAESSIAAGAVECFEDFRAQRGVLFLQIIVRNRGDRFHADTLLFWEKPCK